MTTTAERRLLGWDLAAPALAPVGRDLALVRRTDGTLDLGTVQGASSVGQSLAMALGTAAGSDPFNVNFGFDGLLALVEETNPHIQRDRLRASVAATVGAHPRVVGIRSVEIADDPLTRTFAVQLEVELPGATTAVATVSLGV